MSDLTKFDECQCCGFETILTRYGRAYHIVHKLEAALERGEPVEDPDDYSYKWECELCASTLAGNSIDYPDQYPERAVLQAVCYVGNAILTKLEAISVAKT